MKKITLAILTGMAVIACNRQTGKPASGTTPDADIPEALTMPNFSHHKRFSHLNFTTERQWDSLQNTSPASVPKSRYNIHEDYKTFGWHLYSKGSAYKNYNFSLLWGVAYFSYDVDPQTGGYKSIHQWKTTALADSARAHNCKVFLSVSNFGSENNAVFLGNPKAQQTLIDSLGTLLAFRNADGVNIDFEGIGSKSGEAFNDFVVKLSKGLRRANPDYMISVSLYAVDYHKVFNIKKLNLYVDFYTLMAYDYYGGFSKTAGPVSPLKGSDAWGPHSVASSVDYYLNEGVGPDSLIVGLPYYGAEWRTQDENIPSEAVKFRNNHTYSFIKDFTDSLQLNIDYNEKSASSYAVFKQRGEAVQFWFDDSLSLSHKYDWIKSKKLSGAAVWALGYDNGHTALWELLADKFAKQNSQDSVY